MLQNSHSTMVPLMNSIIRYAKLTGYAGFTVLPVRYIFAAIFSLLLLAGGASGQSDTDGSTPLGLAPGAPAGSYSLSGFDNVNLFNGNLNFQLPLLGVSGRGGARYQMTLPIDQTWTVFRQKNEITGVVTHHPEPNWWEGIKPGYGPGVMQGRKGGTGSLFCGQNSPWYRYSQTLTRLTFTAADGTEFELRDQLTAGEPKTPPSCFAGFSRGRNFISADGSSATFISDSDILDTVIVSEDAGISFPSGYLMLRDGTRYRLDSGKVTWMRDRNGNKLSFTYDGFSRVTTITDSLNRQVTIVYDVKMEALTASATGSPTAGSEVERGRSGFPKPRWVMCSGPATRFRPIVSCFPNSMAAIQLSTTRRL